MQALRHYSVVAYPFCSCHSHPFCTRLAPYCGFECWILALTIRACGHLSVLWIRKQAPVQQMFLFWSHCFGPPGSCAHGQDRGHAWHDERQLDKLCAHRTKLSNEVLHIRAAKQVRFSQQQLKPLQSTHGDATAITAAKLSAVPAILSCRSRKSTQLDLQIR